MIDQNIPLSQLAEQTAQQFQQRYGRAPKWIAAAPGRVNLIGEHTDYNDGFVFPMAIERYTVIAADRPSVTGRNDINWHCARTNQTASFPLTKPVPKAEPKHWTNYIRGVFAGFQNRGLDAGPLDVLMASTVPLGGGLSSSAALEVATATLIEIVSNQRLERVTKALLCQKAEHDYAGMPCGIMDQFISTLGEQDHLLLLDCRSRAPELVPMTDPGVEVLIVNTNVKHELVGGEYAQRRRQCEEAAKALGVPALRDATADALEGNKGKLDPVAYRRAKHVIGENERTEHAAHGVRASNWPTVGQLMYASHLSLKDDYEVSCAELDAVVEIAHDIGIDGGVYGCRMTGGGFGGCCVALVQTDATKAVAAQIADAYEKRTKIKPTLFVSRPAAGATVVKGGV
ncbi:MAG: galactokinase [Verrucomicrobia bacterium]|nr:galactokinase [Verrucomicrobiota bacterium]